MPTCHEMRKDEVYYCPICGIELLVVAECRDVGKPDSECSCLEDDPIQVCCAFNCCGRPLEKKSSKDPSLGR
jgi:hypothetical protein